MIFQKYYGQMILLEKIGLGPIRNGQLGCIYGKKRKSTGKNGRVREKTEEYGKKWQFYGRKWKFYGKKRIYLASHGLCWGRVCAKCALEWGRGGVV